MATLREEQQVEPEHHNGQQAANESAEQTVTAVFDGIFHIIAEAEDDADAGKRRVAVNEAVDDGHQHGGDGGFDGAPADMQLEIGVGDAWHFGRFGHGVILLLKNTYI